MNNQGPKTASEQINRACDACRLHKIRCIPNNSASSKSCQRCSRTDRPCIFTAPQKRKQRKRTDTRVAELEREVQAMRSLFESKTAVTQAETPGSGHSQNAEKVNLSNNEPAKSEPSSNITSTPNETPHTAPSPDISSPKGWSPTGYSPDQDVVDRGIISSEEADQLFHTYNKHLVHHYPAVVFPSTTSAIELRQTKPTLFLSVIAAAAGMTDPHLYSVLNSEVLSAYAHRTIVLGEKSLELVQAMLVTSIWYYPPGKWAKLKFYEYIHMASIMALDIGLGTNPNTSRRRRGVNSEQATSEPPEEMDLEGRRTFLVCYMITSGVSMSMRRPNMLRFNNWIGECLETFASSPNQSKLDEYLVAWVRLIKITEELGSSLSFEDPSNMADLSESRVQILVGGYEKALGSWKRTFEVEDSINDALMLQYYHAQLYLHEIALHDDHPPDTFMPPYNLEKVLSIQLDPQAKETHIDAVAILISSAHSLLNILLAMNVDVLRALPIFNYVRMSYAIIILTKLHISSKSPESRVGSALKPELLKLTSYLDAIIKKLICAVMPKEFRAPYTFLGFLMRLQAWYKAQEKEETFVVPAVSGYEDCIFVPAAQTAHPGAVKGKDLNSVTGFNRDLPTSHQIYSDGTVQNDILQSGFQGMDLDGGMQSQTWDDMDTKDEFPGENFEHELAIDQYMSFDGMEPFNYVDFGWMPDMGVLGVMSEHQGSYN